MAMQSLDQENPPYISVVREFAGDGSKSVLWIRDLADAKEIDLRRSLVVASVILFAVFAGSFPGSPLCSGIHSRVVGAGQALRSDPR